MRNTILIGLAGVLLAILLSRWALSPAPEEPSGIRATTGTMATPAPLQEQTGSRAIETPPVSVQPIERPPPQNDVAGAARDRRAAEQGDARAQVALGSRYLAGNGVPVNEAEALRWFRAAADQGNSAGQMQIGLMYEYGQSVAKDLDAAAEWFTMAAAQGDPAAQANLGDMFESGDGYINYKQAAYWYRQAAKQGYPTAQRDLGRLYETGKGVEQDYRQAYLWYTLAAAKGDETAARNRDLIASRLLPVQIAEAQKLALEWRPKPPKPQQTTEPQ